MIRFYFEKQWSNIYLNRMDFYRKEVKCQTTALRRARNKEKRNAFLGGLGRICTFQRKGRQLPFVSRWVIHRLYGLFKEVVFREGFINLIILGILIHKLPIKSLTWFSYAK